MTSPIDLNRYRMQRDNESMFLTCKCGCAELLVVCMAGKDAPFIASLVCPDCDSEMPISNGTISTV